MKKIATQPKQSIVPDKQGTLYVTGYEDRVSTFRLNTAYMSKLEDETDEEKDSFRAIAKKLASEAGERAQRVLFTSGEGPGVLVSIADPEKEGNRKEISDKVKKQLITDCGMMIEDLGVTAVAKSIVLNGRWVSFFESLLQQEYTAKGLEIPEGVDEKYSMKLTEEGVHKLARLKIEGSIEERKAAELLLENAIKAPTVAVEKK